MPDEPVPVTSSTGTLRLGQAPEREERAEAPQAKAPEKRVPLGAPLQWTDADLDALSVVSEQDVLDAQSFAAQHGSPEFQALLNAEPEEEA
jgi:hypothetical protein